MIILDKPYVSDYLFKLLEQKRYPVLGNSTAKMLKDSQKLNILDSKEFASLYKENRGALYSNSENAIGWIAENLSDTPLPNQISIFKDKAAFRRFIRNIYPNFYFKEVSFAELDNFNKDELQFPLIIKPSVGFFSMAVYRVDNLKEWNETVSLINEHMHTLKDIYPEQVMNSSNFIIEEVIEGVEYAVDAYYNEKSEPVILNVLKHSFGSEKDMSDRVYSFSKKIIIENSKKIMPLLKEIGERAELKNFPIHIEIRIDKDNNIVPIEVNPMRFAGWCVTDISGICVGLSTYEYFIEGLIPDFNQIFKGIEDKVYNLVLIDMPSDVKAVNVKSFNYEKLMSRFTKVMEIRKINYNEYPVFAFLFVETDSEDSDELKSILKSDIKEFIEFN